MTTPPVQPTQPVVQPIAQAVTPAPQKPMVDLLLLEEIGPPTKPKAAIADDEVEGVLLLMRDALKKDLEDEDQTKLVDAIQQHRALLLRYAMQQYLSNPKSASLLEGVSSLMGHMEKAVRDDRKEKMKKQDGESNVLHFNQMLEAMKMISANKVAVPSFELASFILDPTKPLIPLTNSNIAPIKPEELVQGNQIVDIDGNGV